MLPEVAGWKCAPYPAGEALARRGLADPAAACAFLAAGDSHPAESLPAIADACEAILRHVAAGTPIAVFGDYDVDGVCATAILLRMPTFGTAPSRSLIPWIRALSASTRRSITALIRACFVL